MTGKYKRWADRYAILNFQISGHAPTNQDNLPDTVYTMVRETNVLYKGPKKWKTGASKLSKLPTPPTAKYSTLIRAARGNNHTSVISKLFKILC
jgi:hypothetical protein